MVKNKYPRLTVDGIIIKNKKILLIQRKNEPYKNYYALPGGFVNYGETVEKAIEREIKEETNLKIKVKKLAGVYSNPQRDPRGHIISLVFFCQLKNNKLKFADDAQSGKWVPISKIPRKLAFDHYRIIKEFLKNVYSL